MAIFRPIILAMTFCLIGIPTYSQSTLGKISSYKDFILDGNYVWLLTNSGEINGIDLISGKPVGQAIKLNTPIIAMAKDQADNLVVADTAHTIQRYDRIKTSWHIISTYTGKLTGLTFNSANQCFAITNNGIVCVSEGKRYFPDSALFLNDQIRNRKTWFGSPVYLMDSRNQLWIGFDYGEWGGDVFTFDTKQRVFKRLQINGVEMNVNPVSAFCEDSTNVYISSGLSHMMMTHGSIIKFSDNTGTIIISSKDKEGAEKITFTGTDGKKKSVIGTTWKGGQQIGPIAYNPTNKAFYFYSQDGLFKGNSGDDLSDIKHWQNILKPKLQWTGGRPNAAGPAMNVLKMQFTSNGTLVFLTEHDGLGVYDNKTLRFIK